MKKKLLQIFALITVCLAALTLDARRYRGGGWGWGFGVGYPWGGWGWGYPYYAPYYAPTYYYPPRRVIIEKREPVVISKKQTWIDAAGYETWRVENNTKHHITVIGPNQNPMTIPAGGSAHVTHRGGWELNVQYKNQNKNITTQKHLIIVSAPVGDTLQLTDE
jgi:hypothetical protein